MRGGRFEDLAGQSQAVFWAYVECTYLKEWLQYEQKAGLCKIPNIFDVIHAEGDCKGTRLGFLKRVLAPTQLPLWVGAFKDVHSIFSSGVPRVSVDRAVMNSLKVTTPSLSESKPANKSSWMKGSSKPIPFITTLKSFFVIVPIGASFLNCLCMSLISFVVSFEFAMQNEG